MRKIGLVLLSLSMITAMVCAQNLDFNIMGAGARAHGMGGAFIGMADDATAIGWNPAGIAQLEKMEASVNGLFKMQKFEFERTGPSPLTEDNSVSHFAPSFGSFIVPLKMGEKNLVFGIAYQRLIDFGYADKDTGHWSPTVTWEEKTTQKGGIDAIAPAIAVQVTPQLMIGVAGNILINGTTYESKRSYSDGDWYKNEQENSYSGFGLNAGALISLQKINIGVAARLPFTLTEEIKESYSESMAGVAFSSATTQPKAEVKMPLMLGVGMAVKPTDKFTLAADYEYRGYESSEVTQSGTTIEMGWKNVNQFRVGLEYIFSGPNAVFPVRLGFRTDPKVFHGWYGDGTDTSQAVGKVFTGGFGLIMGRVMLDLAYEYETVYYRDWSNAVVTVKDKEVSHNIMASTIFHF
jgi:long-subunit fatty acid transport protein